MEPPSHLLRDGVVYLGFALIAVLTFRRLGLGATLGYLVAGALIGPQGLALIGRGGDVMPIAEIGIILLMFIVGLELTPARLMRLRRDIFGLGLAQVVLCSVVIAALVWLTTGFTIAAAIALGLPLALSSTAQVLPMLSAEGRLNTPFGERTFAVLLFQDLSIVPLITIIAALSRAPVDPHAAPGWMLAIYTVLAVGGLVLGGRYILNPLFRLIGRIGGRELFVVAGLFTVLAAALLMQSFGLSTALGAFVAGVMLADSPYRHELEADIEPFRSLLLGLFFISVGMMLDLQVVMGRPLMVLGLALLVIITKTLVIWAIARAFGMANRSALALGLLLSQGGEFAFVLFSDAQQALLIAPEAASLFGAVVTLSMAMTPLLMIGLRKLVPEAVAGGASLPGPEEGETPHAILIGYGRFGQTVAQMLLAKGLSVTLIDSNPQQIERAASHGMKVYYGDGQRIDLLRRAGGEEARLIVFCVDGRWLERKTVQMARQSFPQAEVLMRVYDRQHLLDLGDVAAGHAIRELWESAIAMGRLALARIDVEPDVIDEIEIDYRRRDEKRLTLQRASGDMHSGSNIIYHMDGERPDEPEN